MDVEQVRVILERTFEMPVAESDAQIVLDRVIELQAKEAAEQSVHRTSATCDCQLPPSSIPHCGCCGLAFK